MEDEAAYHFDPVRLRRIVRRLSYIGLTIVDITFATSIWSSTGYLDLPSLVAVWILLVVAGVSLVAASTIERSGKGVDYLFVALLLPTIAALFVALLQSFPVFGTDELAIDTYSAYLFMHGLNPYNNANMLNVFSFYSVPLYFITPVLTGGYVHYLTYPGLSVLLFIPAVALKFQSSIVLIIFNLIAFLVLFLYYRRSRFTEFFPYAAFALLININWVYYSVGGVTDIVWVVLVALAYIYRKSPYASGALFGLAIAFKQTPAVIFPFFLYFMYMESDRKIAGVARFSGAVAAGFLLPNLPFIALSPAEWFHNVAGVASQPIIGIGLGPSILAFSGILQIASFVFYIVPALILVACFIIYVSNYKTMKYTFFAFPVLAFVLYYRLLLNYIIYWPFMVLLLLPDLLREIGALSQTGAAQSRLKGLRDFLDGISRKKVEAVLLSLILVAGIAVTAYGFAVGSRQPLKIVGVGGFRDTASTGTSVTMMNVTLDYTPLEGGQAHIPVYFRILTDSHIISANGLLWNAQNPIISPGTNNLTIVPYTSVDYLQQGISFRLIAYYGNYQATFSSPGAQVGAAVLFVNPELVSPGLNNSGQQPPGWYFTPDNSGGSTAYTASSGELELSAMKDSYTTAWAVSQYTNLGINMTGLAKGNYTLSYTLSINANSTVAGSNVTAKGMPDIFYGVQLQFAGDAEQIWIGYNSSVALSMNQPNSNTLVILTNSTVINFSELYNLVTALGWPTSGAGFCYLVGSWTQAGGFGARFNSFVLKGV